MRPPRSLRPHWRQLFLMPRRSISSIPAGFSNIKYELLARPQKSYFDYLTPTNSHLLHVTLADYIPPEWQPYPSSPSPTSTASTDSHWTVLPNTPSPSPSEKGEGKSKIPVLPQGHHLVYFPPTHPTATLLPDGTDTDHWPGLPFERRLWAGGSVCFADGWEREMVLDGRRAVCLEKIEDVRLTGVPAARDSRHEDGSGGTDVDMDVDVDRNGALAWGKLFVDVVRRYGSVGEAGDKEAVARVASSPAILERRTLVFLAKPGTENPRRSIGRSIAGSPVLTHALTPSPSLLFRFSALTFNAHAIHLDPHHCREVEGYRNMLVHGPLLLTMLFSALKGASHLSAKQQVIKSIEYSNLAPVFAAEDMRVSVKKAKDSTWRVWVEGPEGGLCVKASANFFV